MQVLALVDLFFQSRVNRKIICASVLMLWSGQHIYCVRVH